MVRPRDPLPRGNVPGAFHEVGPVPARAGGVTRRRGVAVDERGVVLLRDEGSGGVGGAMVTGYRECLRLGADVVVKMDGDDQMDPGRLPALVEPLLNRQADYTKGNRWVDPISLRQMPRVRR